MATVRGGPVLGHVQAFADAVVSGVGLKNDNPGTYPGHQPTRDRALDIFVPVNDRTLGDKVCAFALMNVEHYGVRYVIFRRRIWHRADRRWVQMEDRGGDTANHVDHVHISFEPTATAQPTPTPQPQEDDMKWLAKHNPTGVWMVDGIHKVGIKTKGIQDYWLRQGVKWLPENSGYIQDDVFNNLVELKPE